MLQFCSDDKIVYFTFTVTSQSIYENKLDIISYVGINKAKKKTSYVHGIGFVAIVQGFLTTVVLN